MLTIDRQTCLDLERRLWDAEKKLPEIIRIIAGSAILERVLRPTCRDDEGTLAWWDRRRQQLGFNGPAIVDLSDDALAGLVAHEMAHIYFHFRNMACAEGQIADMVARWGVDLSPLYREAPPGFGSGE